MNGERPNSNGDHVTDATDTSSDVSADPAQRGIQRLCSTCQSLQLGVHRFKVQTPVSSSRLGVASTNRILRSSSTSTKLGTLAEIKTNSSSCPLCALIFDSVSEVWKRSRQDADENETEKLLRSSCVLTWEIDGRDGARSKRSGRSSNMVRGLTRRMHICWSHPNLSDSYIVYVAPESFSTTASDADRVWDKSSLFLGRKVPEYVENQALVKSWLDLCQKTHQGPCRHQNNLSPQDFHDMVSHSYFGVIDVLNMQLTQLPSKPNPGDGSDRRRQHEQASSGRVYEPYVALSYVWGVESAYTTTTENVMLHRTHGGLENVIQRFPDAIKDAIELVRRLGFKYLWIDRLCIVQDSARSWKLNAYNMDLIYGNAVLTICAADGDASSGLRAMRPENHNLNQPWRKVMRGLDLMVTRPPEIHIRQSAWNERAWTFQERLLSRRCLIFTNGRVYFQCRSTGMSEEIYADRKGAGWSLDLVHAPMQMFRQIDTCAVWVYMRSVELYTERKLTKPKDILAAFSGVSNVLKGRMRAPFIHGLPSSHFDLALLWEPIREIERRVIEESAEKRSYSIPDFPSWSWAGWVGPVAFKDSIVGGLLGNVSEWIDAHTWIEWWIRDAHGDLRPLWDTRKSRMDRSTDSRWRGYRRSGTRADKLGRASPRNNDRYQPEGEHPFEAQNGDEVEPFLEYAREPDQDRDLDVSGRFSESDSIEGSTEHSQDDYQRRRSRSPSPPRHSDEVWRSDRRPGAANDAVVRFQEQTTPVNDDADDNSEVNINIRNRAAPRQEYLRHSPPPPVRSRSFREPSTRTPYNADYSSRPIPPTGDSGFYDMVFGNRGEEFSITLRDYPYRVVTAPYTSKLESFEFPLLPILQFRTWHTLLYVKAAIAFSAEKYEKTENQSEDMGSGQARCHIADDAGDWVGSIVLDAQWMARQSSHRHEFIAISDAKDFTMAECETWTYYIPKERKSSEWDLFYVMLIERKNEKWERVGLGKVFKEAFRNARWKEIMLG
ncbi:heterokaryon incompatibility protein-domain-containing protein [Xylaria bambusicola]|uniref:heterokaryon incompatibility protein-domain-containing protein n=1 Tax=Xylaria bambusicola TaxID=326684 RepID=UPI0020088A74|nr:heterokaryon incompatibility protein-domain-containing protein [Xylaria bambusicola]KAI0526516.1 heterokaryon incompatibility protein-domain-containing protein [Xylaria bambusicola]